MPVCHEVEDTVAEASSFCQAISFFRAEAGSGIVWESLEMSLVIGTQ